MNFSGRSPTVGRLMSPHRDEAGLRDGVLACVDADRLCGNLLMGIFAIGFSTGSSTGSSVSCSTSAALDLRFGRLSST
jgi:hypothetical protein